MGFYRLCVAGFFFGVVGLVGCKGNPGPGLKLQLAVSAREHACVKTDGSGFPLTSALRDGVVRLSVLKKEDAGWQFQCDLQAKLPDDHPSIDLGPAERGQYAFFAELFDSNGNRSFTGAVQGKSSVAADGSAGVLPLFEVGQWSCPASGMTVPRAFHSATALPGGEVLLYGGVEVGIVAGKPGSMGVTETVEVYDPARAVFQTVAVSGSPAPLARAFHQVAVLSATQDTVKLIAFGGITAPRRQEALVVPGAGTNTPLRLAPCGTATKPGGVQLLTLKFGAGSYSLSASEPQDADTAAFSGVAPLIGGGLLMAAGATDFSPLPQCSGGFLDLLKPTAKNVGKQAVAWSGPDAATRSATSVQAGFLAPTVTMISADTAVVLGGEWLMASATAPSWRVLFLTNVPGGLATPLGTGFSGSGSPTAFHTATRLGGPLGAAPAFPVDVLVTGGFEMTDTNTTQPGQPPAANSAVRLYTLQDAASAPTLKSIQVWKPAACGATTDHYRAATFEAASETASGSRVVVTGGSPAFGSCLECEGGDNDLLCSTKQASIYQAGTDTLQQLPPMSMARLGHRQTRLFDGNILVTGGLVRKANTSGTILTQATNEAEVFNPRFTDTRSPDVDDPATLALPAAERPNRTGIAAQKPCSIL